MPVYTYTTFDDPAGTATQAYGINSSGLVVGTYLVGDTPHGFLYNPNGGDNPGSPRWDESTWRGDGVWAPDGAATMAIIVRSNKVVKNLNPVMIVPPGGS